MSVRTRILRLILLAILTPVLFLLGCQSRLIYYPNAYHRGYDGKLERADGQRIRYVTPQGKQTAFYVPAKAGKTDALPEVVWLCFGGNGSLALDWLYVTPQWDGRFAYLMIDYPGYGECGGKPTPARIRESSQAAVAALATHLKVPKETLQPRLAVLGQSIGCAAGLMAADDFDVQKIVLISPFTTMTEMGKRVLGWPLCYLNLHRFDNRTHLDRVCNKGARVILFHGTSDNLIPIRMSRELAAAHASQVTLDEREGQGHNDIVAESAAQIGEAMLTLSGLPMQ